MTNVMAKFWKVAALTIAAIVMWVIAGLLPAYIASVLVLTLAYGYAAACWGLVLHWMGVFSLGHTLFMAAGAYASSYLWINYGLSPWLGMLVGMLVSVLLSVPIGITALRRRVDPLFAALVTLLVVQAASPILARIPALGGAIGIYLPVERGDSHIAMQYVSPSSFVQILLVMSIILFLLIEYLKHSSFGYRVRAVRDDEAAAEASGIPVSRYKVLAFALSALLTAPVGTVLAQYRLYTTPDSTLSISVLISIVIVGLVGGVAHTWGPFLGALIVVPLTQQLAVWTGNRPGVGTLVFAVALTLIALTLPQGISGALDKIRRRRVRTQECSEREEEGKRSSAQSKSHAGRLSS